MFTLEEVEKNVNFFLDILIEALPHANWASPSPFYIHEDPSLLRSPPPSLLYSARNMNLAKLVPRVFSFPSPRVRQGTRRPWELGWILACVADLASRENIGELGRENETQREKALNVMAGG